MGVNLLAYCLEELWLVAEILLEDRDEGCNLPVSVVDVGFELVHLIIDSKEGLLG